MSSRYRQSTGAPTPGRTPGPGRTPARGAPAATPRMGELPPYEPLQFPLTATGRSDLSKLANPRNFEVLTSRFDEIIACLSDVVAEVNETVVNKEKALKKERQRLAAAPEDQDTAANQERIEKMERELADMKASVDKTSQQLDKDVRKMIDAEVTMTDMQSTLHSLATEAANASTQASQPTQRRPRRHLNHLDDEEEEEEEYPDFDPTDPTNNTQNTQRIVAPSTEFRDRLQRARDRYQSRSLVDRYSRHNYYRNFKTVMHEAIHDDDTPLPQEHLWFTAPGTAAPGLTAQNEDSDDDLQISKATISTKCPLTLQEFKDPVTSRKCPHSFEREAIVSMIEDPSNMMRASGVKTVKCPVAGCNSALAISDLHSDPALKRKIARLQRASRAEEESDDDDVEGGAARPESIGSDDDDVGGGWGDRIESSPKRLKTERFSGVTPGPSQRNRGRPMVLELDEDDDE